MLVKFVVRESFLMSGAEIPTPTDIIEMSSVPRLGDQVFVPTGTYPDSPGAGTQVPLIVRKVSWVPFADREYDVIVVLKDLPFPPRKDYSE